VDLPHVSRRRRRGAEAVARADDEGAGGLGAGEGTEIGLVWFGLGVGGVGNRRTVGRLLHSTFARTAPAAHAERGKWARVSAAS
jgi:hypothetical protein